jgi:hypothetical protein
MLIHFSLGGGEFLMFGIDARSEYSFSAGGEIRTALRQYIYLVFTAAEYVLQPRRNEPAGPLLKGRFHRTPFVRAQCDQ